LRKQSRRRRFDDDDAPYSLKLTSGPRLEELPDDQPWSSWDAPGVLHGPDPRPDWVITELAAIDTELGVLKTGKEADVFLVERGIPETSRSVLMAAKRYRAPEHRLFHRDAGYLDGRRVRESRLNRAMANRTSFGREVIAGQWAAAEFDALGRLWQIGQASGLVRVPYPVQLIGTEVMLEFIGDWATGEAAPRLAQVRAEPDELADLWRQMTDALSVLARAQVAHGDLSPYNTLVHDGALVLIDLPQIVDVIANPQGADFIARDVRNVSGWFTQRGLRVDADDLLDRLLHEAGLR
jgi:RIO kinase 1